ncbi:MAG: type IV toxin-antitoxin system AbiEi family antitoxin domain-containing protein [Actinomycetia bacterium]|nr:type IV toxin-antitoxin system AbiEi family antitoxin domain-containing protein [Actinomycetes bacterium]
MALPDDALRHMRMYYGIASRSELMGWGMASASVARSVGSGELVRIHPGVYRHGAVRPSWHGRLLAACLYTGGVATHRAAGRVLGLDGLEKAPVEVVVPDGRRKRFDGIRTRQSTQLDKITCIERLGIPCTPLARTVLDVGADLGLKRLKPVVDSAIRDGKLRWWHLYSVLAVHSEHGRNGCGVLRALLEEEGHHKRVPLSAWSRMAGELLVAHGLPEPEFEYAVTFLNGRVAYIDLAYPDPMIAIELDSRSFHDNDDSFESDRSRTRHLATLGWTVLPLTWAQYLNDGVEFAGQVRTVLARSRLRDLGTSGSRG